MGMPAANQTAFSIACSICDRIEHRRIYRLPEGWTLNDKDDALCPDCKQVTIGIIPPAEELEGNSAGVAPDPDLAGMIDEAVLAPGGVGDFHTTLGFDASFLGKLTFDTPAFGVRLDRQDDGSYLVAFQPWKVLTIWHPMLGYLLTADQADKVAEDLRRYAALSRNPGSVGGGA